MPYSVMVEEANKHSGLFLKSARSSSERMCRTKITPESGASTAKACVLAAQPCAAFDDFKRKFQFSGRQHLKGVNQLAVFFIQIRVALFTFFRRIFLLRLGKPQQLLKRKFQGFCNSHGIESIRIAVALDGAVHSRHRNAAHCGQLFSCNPAEFNFFFNVFPKAHRIMV